MSMTPAPVGGSPDEALDAAILAVQQCLTGIDDRMGGTMTIPVRSLLNEQAAPRLEVVVSIEEGRETFEMGLNTLAFNAGVDTAATRGSHIEDCRVVCEIRANSHAERVYLAARLRTNIKTAWTTDPTTGLVVEAAPLVYLHERGVRVYGFDPTRYPTPEADEARPYGQVFRATVTMLCDIWQGWSTPGATITQTPFTTTPVPS